MSNRAKRQDDALYKRTRPQAIERDGGKCVICGRPMAHVHHIKYRGRGGKSNLENLACLCVYHHQQAHGVHWREVMIFIRERLGYDEKGNSI